MATRFLDPRMFQYAKAVYRAWYVKGQRYVIRTTADFENWFTGVQLPVLRTLGFPQLDIYAAYDRSGSFTGRAPEARVVTEYRYGRNRAIVPYLAGKFSVTLNTYFLGSSTYWVGRDPDYWAGTITHEMMHNLGHDHPEGKYDGVFIRTYEEAVWDNGELWRRNTRR